MPFPFPLPGDLVPLLPGDLVPFPILCMVDMVEEDIIFYIRNKKKQRATVSISSTRSPHHVDTLIPLGIQSTRSSRSVDTLIPSTIRTFDWPFEAWIKAIKRMVRRKAPFFIVALTNSAAVDCRRMTVQVNGDCWWRWRIWRGDQEKDMENPCERMKNSAVSKRRLHWRNGWKKCDRLWRTIGGRGHCNT